MKYLTLDSIKRHLRLDNDCEDAELEMYGSAAEDSILGILGRSVSDLKCFGGGEVPDAVVQATLMITDSLYQHRSPSEVTSLSIVPYGIDLLLKRFIKL